MDVRSIVVKSIDGILNGYTDVSSIECFVCRVIYDIMKNADMDESTAAYNLSEVLSSDRELNERFIAAVEYVHLYSRARALWFYSKSREEKDNYLATHIKNALLELEYEGNVYGREYIVRRLLLAYLFSYIAQIVGMDLHASTEEVYYVLRGKSTLEHELHKSIDRILKETSMK